MGTSQGPVREALQRLEREGLVQRQSHSATFVTALDLDAMYELFSIRSVIEGFAIRHTVECITEEQCDQLAHLTDLMREEGGREDMLGLTVHDMEFHRLICRWSGNATLLRAWDPLYSQIQRFVVRTHRDYFGSVTAVAVTHDPIVAALRSHDVEQVTPLIQQHVMLIWSLFTRSDPKGANQTKEPEDAANATTPRPGSKERAGGGLFIRRLLQTREFGVFLALVALLVLMRFLTPYFWKSDNVFNVLRGMSTIGIMAIGQTMIIITGGIDLSVGAVLAASAMLTARLMYLGIVPPWIAVIIGIGFGTLLGAINGLIITRMKVSPFITTLGMLSIARGLTICWPPGCKAPWPATSPCATNRSIFWAVVMLAQYLFP